MPLRMLIDDGAIDPGDVALVGARNLDPPEVEFIASRGDPGRRGGRARPGRLRLRRPRLRRLRPGELSVYMPEPGGPTVAEVEKLLCGLRDRGAVVGAGLSGLAADPANVEKLERLCTALGF